MPPNLSVKLLIVDDHPLFRQGVRSALPDRHQDLAVGRKGEWPAMLLRFVAPFLAALVGMVQNLLVHIIHNNALRAVAVEEHDTRRVR